ENSTVAVCCGSAKLWTVIVPRISPFGFERLLYWVLPIWNSTSASCFMGQSIESGTPRLPVGKPIMSDVSGATAPASQSCTVNDSSSARLPLRAWMVSPQWPWQSPVKVGKLEVKSLIPAPPVVADAEEPPSPQPAAKSSTAQAIALFFMARTRAYHRARD